MSGEGKFIDNLMQEDLAVNGGLKLNPVIVADAIALTLLASNSGRLHIMPNLTATCTITLPTPSPDLTFEFMYGGVVADAQNWIIDSGANANYFLGGLVHLDTDAVAAGIEVVAIAGDGNSNSKLTIVTPGVSTRIRITSDGLHWYLEGTVVSVTVPAFADQ